jgi:translation initiation factor IF-3
LESGFSEALRVSFSLGPRGARPTVQPVRGDVFIARPPFPGPKKDLGPRANNQITVPKVRLIDHNGNNHGILDTRAALAMAEDAGLDLIEVSPNVVPPVCKILDLGKFKYELQKKANQAKKKQKVQDLKEIKMRPTIDVHDFDVKLRAFQRFIEEGDKVKLTIRFRGREMEHRDIGYGVLKRVEERVNEIAKVDAPARMEGRQMSMVFSPK